MTLVRMVGADRRWGIWGKLLDTVAVDLPTWFMFYHFDIY